MDFPHIPQVFDVEFFEDASRERARPHGGNE
jgi:hypothetical protein